MDAQLKQDIMDHYRSKYFQYALTEKPGLMGKLMRWDNERAIRHIDLFIGAIGFIIGTAIVMFPAGVLTGSVLVGGFVGSTSAILAYLAPLAIGNVTTSASATKLMEKDIENGALIASYAAVLAEKMRNLPALKQEKMAECLSIQNTLLEQSAQLAAAFTAVATGSKEKPSAAAKTAAPEAPKTKI